MFPFSFLSLIPHYYPHHHQSPIQSRSRSGPWNLGLETVEERGRETLIALKATLFFPRWAFISVKVKLSFILSPISGVMFVVVRELELEYKILFC